MSLCGRRRQTARTRFGGLLLSIGDVPELEAGVDELGDIDHMYSGRTVLQPQRDGDVVLRWARDPIEARTREPYAYAGNARIDDRGRSVASSLDPSVYRGAVDEVPTKRTRSVRS